MPGWRCGGGGNSLAFTFEPKFEVSVLAGAAVLEAAVAPAVVSGTVGFVVCRWLSMAGSSKYVAA